MACALRRYGTPLQAKEYIEELPLSAKKENSIRLVIYQSVRARRRIKWLYNIQRQVFTWRIAMSQRKKLKRLV
ncbi:MAG: hypothetical protein P8X74_20005 [Reinekea sp.]